MKAPTSLPATDHLTCASPNHGPRRDGLRPRLVVLHYTAMASAEAARDRLCDPAHEVSAHWLIGRDGRLWSLVDEAERAWHAGTGSWGGRGDVNSRSIGIEIDNDGTSPFSAPAMARLEGLVGGVLARYRLGPEAVIAHSDLAPRRKSDPGQRFDWRRLARQGLAVWPEAALAPGADPVTQLRNAAAPPDSDAFLSSAKAFGWPVGEGLDPVLGALRLRFRPQAGGALDACDLAIAAELARRFPVDRGAART